MILLIACINKNRGLGFKNQLLYKIPEDLIFFKEKTAGHAVIMGKKTFESIGRPLPNRTNIIVTRDENFKAEQCVVCHSVDEALQKASASPSLSPPLRGEDEGGGEIFIIGGAQIYAQTIDKADRLYLTIVADVKKADAFFPAYDAFKQSSIISKGEHKGLKYQILEFSK